ncbi:MAG: S46 family peptidase [Salinibacter sp.]
MRTPIRSLVVILLGIGLFVGCGGSETVSVPVVERSDTGAGAEDTLQKASGLEDLRGSIPMGPTVSIPVGYDTVQAQRFDRGRMWTFATPPTKYLRERYGVTPDEEWLTKLKRGTLQFGDGCSASFVSSRGLVMTNHHCARDYVTDVSRKGESLLENGFYAETQGEERRAQSLHVDQLVKVEDVTQRVFDGLRRGRRAPASARTERVSVLEEKMTAKVTERDSALRVKIQPTYRGTRYTAYTYRRYRDVRLVMVPSLQLGYFGGAADNFTYPRYALDVAFFRVYGSDGKPLQPEHYFSWAEEGARPQDPVFAVGHPQSTSRFKMVSQLKYLRNHQLPNRLETLRKRRQVMGEYITAHPDSAKRYDLRNTYFSIRNTIKGKQGQLRGLQDPYLLARRGAAIQALQDSIQAVDSLRQRYGTIISQIDRLQQSKAIIADKASAFTTFSNLKLGSRILVRALHGYYYDFLRTRGAPPDRIESIREDAEKITDWPPGLEKKVLLAQFREIREAYGADHPTVQRLFTSRTPEELATRLVEKSALLDSTAFLKLLDEGYRQSNDPSVPVIEALAPMYLNVTRQIQDVRQSERRLSARLSRARFAIYGTHFPPDATGSLRLSDGRVKGYRYNGTTAPPFTQFFGLYDRYHSHNQEAWSLPPKWSTAADSLDLGTPLNLVSTVDISGGSSGSPLLNKDLELVGVVFDSNMEGLPNEYLFRTHSARAVAVDVRGILEALRTVYDADRLVAEVTGASSSPSSDN